jgi:hypothetical protein
MESIMTKNGNVEQQPGAGKGVEIAVNENTGTIEALIDSMDAVVEKTPEVKGQDSEVSETTEETTEAAETPEAEETPNAPETPEVEEETHEDAIPEEHKAVFSEKAHEIFKERIGKKNKQLETVRTELEAVKAERDSLKKSADPAMRDAVTAAGIAPEFLDDVSAKTIAEAEKVQRRITWAREASKNPDGYEDAQSGKVYTQAELQAYALEAATDPDNMAVLAEARAVRKAAQARQKEAIQEGLKILAARESAKKALKPEAKKPVKASPPAPSGASAVVSKDPAQSGDYRDKFRKSGRTISDLIDAST